MITCKNCKAYAKPKMLQWNKWKFEFGKLTIEKCKRCGGEGRILTYSYVHNGICLRCDGTGKENVSR